MDPYTRQQQAEARALAVLGARRQGATLRQIAEQQGVTVQRVQQLEARGVKIEHQRASTDPQWVLPVRARNVLFYDECDLVPEAVVARYATIDDLARVHGIGSLRIREIQQWLVQHGHDPISSVSR